MSRFNKVCAGYSWLNYPSLNKKVCKVKIICLVAVYSPRLLVSCKTDVTPGCHRGSTGIYMWHNRGKPTVTGTSP